MLASTLAALLQTGASIYGAYESRKEQQQVLDSLKAERQENRERRDARLAEDYMQRADVQNVLRKQRELLNEQYQRARATNVVAGGTDESLALQQQAANNTLGETGANIAAQSASYKEGVENQFEAQEAALKQQQRAIHMGQAQQIAQAAGQVGQAVSGLANAGLGDTTAKASQAAVGTPPPLKPMSQQVGTTPTLPELQMTQANKDALNKQNN